MTNETEDKSPTISDDLVVTKYKMAAEIVNRKSIEFPAQNETRVSGFITLFTTDVFVDLTSSKSDTIDA